MKGMVFTEFLEMVETQFSADMVDDISTTQIRLPVGLIPPSARMITKNWLTWWLRYQNAPASKQMRWCKPLAHTFSAYLPATTRVF